MSDLDWEDRERVLRLMFSKMNTGQPASHWRQANISTANNEGTTGVGSQRANAALNQSFREEDDEYDQEVDAENASNTNIFRKTNIDEYTGS